MADNLQSDEKSRVITGPTILLSNGAYFDFLDPAASTWGVVELAAALAKCCRFAGHCHSFYSVAEHSLNVARLVPAEHRLAALLHDAHEAFTGDITYPLKRMLGDAVRDIERRIDDVLFPRFGVELPLPATIKDADRWMLWIEQRQLMSNRDEWSATARPPFWAEERIGTLACWDWRLAFSHWALAVREEVGKLSAVANG